MPQQARDAEFAPHAAIDLRDQNSMFLALEELGIACMQDAWIRSNPATRMRPPSTSRPRNSSPTS